VPIYFEFRPIESWPAGTERTPVGERRVSKFKASLSETIDLLDSEMRLVGAQRGAVEIAISSRELSAVGVPFAGYKAKDPAVILKYIDEQGVAITMPCDTFFTWQENLRAIALTVRNLRKCEDYGAVRRGQQFRGFAALPAVTTSALSYEQAAKTALRLALHNTHPEKTGNGSSNDFVLAQECKRVLQAKHGVDL
jgi:hypothetical protein